MTHNKACVHCMTGVCPSEFGWGSPIFPVWISYLTPTSLSLSEYIQKYATEEALKEQEEGGGDSSDKSSMSDFSEDEAQDMEL